MTLRSSLPVRLVGLMNSMLTKKAVALGECHGIANLVTYKTRLARDWAEQGLSVAVCLERDFDHQVSLNKWLFSGQPDPRFRDKFLKPKTAQFLEDQFFFFDELARISRRFPGRVRVLCVDISFKHPDAASRAVLNARDENEFDRLREKFIIERMQARRDALDRSDRILWIAGNMHAAKFPFYFPLDSEPCPHIETAAMWLNERYGAESIFTLPFAGQYNYNVMENRGFQNSTFALPFSGS